MKFQKLGNSPGRGPEAAERERFAKELAVQKVRNWTGQSGRRGDLRVEEFKRDSTSPFREKKEWI